MKHEDGKDVVDVYVRVSQVAAAAQEQEGC